MRPNVILSVISYNENISYTLGFHYELVETFINNFLGFHYELVKTFINNFSLRTLYHPMVLSCFLFYVT